MVSPPSLNIGFEQLVHNSHCQIKLPYVHLRNETLVVITCRSHMRRRQTSLKEGLVVTQKALQSERSDDHAYAISLANK